MTDSMNDEFETMSSGSLGDFLESELRRGSDEEVDDLLDVIAREVNDNAIGQDPLLGSGIGCNGNLDLDPSEFEAFTGSLQESLAKFDEFLERTNATGLDELDDELTELRPIETLREKRSREQETLQSLASPFGSDTFSRIRTISGEKLSSMPAMHQGYATTSSLNKKSTLSANEPQRNQTWDIPEPIIGEVTGNKMRRLLSEKSYFQSRPAPSEASKNAPWNQPKPAAPKQSTISAMQTLLNTGTAQVPSQAAPSASGSTASGWPPANHALGRVTVAQMQQRASMGQSPPTQTTAATLQTGIQGTGVRQSGGVPAQSPAFAGVSLEDMQRLASAGPPFSTQATSATAGWAIPQGSAQCQASHPMFAVVTLQDMQHLASSGFSIPAQAGMFAAVQRSAPRNTLQSGGFAVPAPNPNFASVSLQDMQRLAATGVAAPAQAATAAPPQSSTGQNAMPPPTPMFAAVSLQDMQRLAATGINLSSQPAQASSANASQNVAQAAPTPPWSAVKPAFVQVTAEDMQRLASTGVSFPTQSTPAGLVGGVPNPPWAQGARPAFGTGTMQATNRPASSGAGVPTQAASNLMGSGTRSFGNIPQAAAAPKPSLATVSLEDMHRLARTGISRPMQAPPSVLGNPAAQNEPWNVSKPSNGITSMGSLRQPTANGTNTPSHAAAVASGTATATQQTTLKPTFASVTLEDMQRLVNAYNSHSSQAPPAAATSKDVAPKPTPGVVSMEQLQPAANESPESVTQRHFSGSESGSGIHGSSDDRMDHSWNSVSSTATAPEADHVIFVDPAATPPKNKVSGGPLQQMQSDPSFFTYKTTESRSSGISNTAWPDAVSSRGQTGVESTGTDGSGAPSDEESRKLPSDPEEMVKKLRALMDRSSTTQQALQEFDKQRGLPRSHSQTMVNSSRSRRQLLEGKVIAKWDGSPLISDEIELGKPKPRSTSKNQTGGGKKEIVSSPVASL